MAMEDICQGNPCEIVTAVTGTAGTPGTGTGTAAPVVALVCGLCFRRGLYSSRRRLYWEGDLDGLPQDGVPRNRCEYSCSLKQEYSHLFSLHVIWLKILVKCVNSFHFGYILRIWDFTHDMNRMNTRLNGSWGTYRQTQTQTLVKQIEMWVKEWSKYKYS